jgi:CheY-like chemotaxis protein
MDARPQRPEIRTISTYETLHYFHAFAAVNRCGQSSGPRVGRRTVMSRILVVDDEFYVRSFLRRTLERLGHTVAEAANGREAMQQFMSFNPACVITDLLMPEQEGMETIREMRRHCHQVRIVAISGSFHPMVSINRLVEAIGPLEQTEHAAGNP